VWQLVLAGVEEGTTGAVVVGVVAMAADRRRHGATAPSQPIMSGLKARGNSCLSGPLVHNLISNIAHTLAQQHDKITTRTRTQTLDAIAW
jgi:hypothetical protein